VDVSDGLSAAQILEIVAQHSVEAAGTAREGRQSAFQMQMEAAVKDLELLSSAIDLHARLRAAVPAIAARNRPAPLMAAVVEAVIGGGGGDAASGHVDNGADATAELAKLRAAQVATRQRVKGLWGNWLVFMRDRGIAAPVAAGARALPPPAGALGSVRVANSAGGDVLAGLPTHAAEHHTSSTALDAVPPLSLPLPTAPPQQQPARAAPSFGGLPVPAVPRPRGRH
jgi:hypothetical protein